MANYRNPMLLRLAAKAPHCMGCLAANVGQVVAAHSNHHADGKGMGLKASDAMVAFLCTDCHASIDQGGASRELKRAAWVEAYMATMRWLVESGHFIVSPVPTPPPVIEAKPKAKIPARKAAWGSRPMESASRPIPARKDPWPKGRKLGSRPMKTPARSE